VKLGQILATRPDLIPPETAHELGKLHQDVEPVPRNVIQPAIEAALGRSVDDTFAEFDWTPVGAGSIGQVYRARLVSGEPVIVKVRRPDIDTIIERDLRMALDLVALVDEHSEQAQSLGVAGIADQFAAQLRAEMDYRVEARNTIEAAAALSDQDVIVVPMVFEDLSGESVLVLEAIEGEILGRHGIVGGEAGRRLADALFRAEVDAMLTGERFNADPHPGNIILVPDGGLGLIDFGSAGRLDAFERSAVTDIMTALAFSDPTMLRAAALQIGMGASGGRSGGTRSSVRPSRGGSPRVRRRTDCGASPGFPRDRQPVRAEDATERVGDAACPGDSPGVPRDAQPRLPAHRGGQDGRDGPDEG
jgi:ubiquinone biosynthesis protein